MSSASAVNGIISNTGMDHPLRMMLFHRRDVGCGVTLGQLSADGFNAFADLLHGTVEVARASFNHQGLNAELGRKPLCLETLLGVIGRQHLLDKGAVAFADINR